MITDTDKAHLEAWVTEIETLTKQIKELEAEREEVRLLLKDRVDDLITPTNTYIYDVLQNRLLKCELGLFK